MEYRRPPIWLDEWFDVAIEVERERRYVKGLDRVYGNSPPSSKPSGTPAKTSTPQYVPMDTTAGQATIEANASTFNPSTLSPEKQELFKQGHCYRCQQQGHLAKNCTINPPKPRSIPVRTVATSSKPPA